MNAGHRAGLCWDFTGSKACERWILEGVRARPGIAALLRFVVRPLMPESYPLDRGLGNLRKPSGQSSGYCQAHMEFRCFFFADVNRFDAPQSTSRPGLRSRIDFEYSHKHGMQVENHRNGTYAYASEEN